MKISKVRLKQIIKEEMEALTPPEPINETYHQEEERWSRAAINKIFAGMQDQLDFAQVTIEESTGLLQGEEIGLRGEDIDNVKLNIESIREMAEKITHHPAYALDDVDFDELDELLAEVHDLTNAAIDGPGVEKLLDGLDDIEDLVLDLQEDFEEYQF